MLPNIPVIIACAFIPMIIAFVWYHPKIFGKKWQASVGMSDESFNTPPRPYQFVLSLILNFLLAFGVFVVTVHQTHVLALTGPDIEAFKTESVQAFMNNFGGNFTTWSHGLTHGLLIAFLAFALSFIGSTAIWEKNGIAYVLVNGGYWLVSLVQWLVL